MGQEQGPSGSGASGWAGPPGGRLRGWACPGGEGSAGPQRAGVGSLEEAVLGIDAGGAGAPGAVWWGAAERTTDPKEDGPPAAPGSRAPPGLVETERWPLGEASWPRGCTSSSQVLSVPWPRSPRAGGGWLPRRGHWAVGAFLHHPPPAGGRPWLTAPPTPQEAGAVTMTTPLKLAPPKRKSAFPVLLTPARPPAPPRPPEPPALTGRPPGLPKPLAPGPRPLPPAKKRDFSTICAAFNP